MSSRPGRRRHVHAFLREDGFDAARCSRWCDRGALHLPVRIEQDSWNAVDPADSPSGSNNLEVTTSSRRVHLIAWALGPSHGLRHCCMPNRSTTGPPSCARRTQPWTFASSTGRLAEPAGWSTDAVRSRPCIYGLRQARRSTRTPATSGTRRSRCSIPTTNACSVSDNGMPRGCSSSPNTTGEPLAFPAGPFGSIASASSESGC